MIPSGGATGYTNRRAEVGSESKDGWIEKGSEGAREGGIYILVFKLLHFFQKKYNCVQYVMLFIGISDVTATSLQQ